MALTDYEIQESDYTGNDISGLSDKPSLTAAQLKARFDSLVKNVVVAKFNALITALVTTVSGLISKVSGGTEGNFASLTSGGEVQDSGYKAADFAAASHVTDTDNPHSVTATQAGALPISGGTMTGTTPLKFEPFPGNGYANVVMNQSASADWGMQLNDYDSSGNRVSLQLSAGKYADGTLTSPIRVLISGSTYNILTSKDARREYSTSITVDLLHWNYDISVSWAKTGMWFEAIRTDYNMTYWWYPVRATCSTDGTVSVTFNGWPDSGLDGATVNLKISGWL